ncbi:MAG TPA: thymidine phosphorylase [Thermotogota bacterium]|nr:thymidine phosphorylase [Thermotogota bacterium]HPJ87702.1 thymidine phosphorylase [Thermotogota bacterium]HPR94859.1 thymidine phosphorylase [Thermotogota bacterium]
MRMYDLILKKRNGLELTKEEIEYIISGYVDGSIPEYQVSAFLMACYFKHLTKKETYLLTECMRYSGDTVDLSAIQGIKVDKHSTGGVGDKTTLTLAPMVAACGAKVAKLSGRGLGHTGGTIDKLESIRGFNTSVAMDDWIDQVNSIGIAVAGQTANLVPADKKIYGLRDVTATVDEASLIASSIMSKKLAGGADAFVLDVKVGSGAFMKDVESASELAHIMVDIANNANKKACAILTNMDQPLGNKIGNALEVEEAIDTLKGNGPADFTELCMILGEKMLKFALGIPETTARKRLEEAVDSGAAYQKFIEFVKAQNGDISALDSLVKCKGIYEYKAEETGYISGINTEKIGIAAMVLGAGREKKDDILDFSVGFDFVRKTGAYVKKGEKILDIYYNDEKKLASSIKCLENSICFDKSESVKKPLIFDIIE